MGEREHRLAENQSIFRDVNELSVGRAAEEGRLEFLCECGDLSCKERIRMAAADYEAVRAESRQFALKPGHELLESEEPVWSGDGFLVVRKFGEAGEAAEELDPRDAD